MIHLHKEGNAVGIFASYAAKHAKGRGNGIATTLNGKFHDVLRIEVEGIGRKAGPG